MAENSNRGNCGRRCPRASLPDADRQDRQGDEGLAPGETLKVIATDRGAIADVPAWAGSTGNELLEWHEEGDAFVFLLRKGEEN